MWGQVNSILIKQIIIRIIPTRVGTRRQLPFITINGKDHPHACGDKFTIFRGKNWYRGSSPRVWGQGFKKSCNLGAHRIIPTRVGTSYFMKMTGVNGQDHPHACGDKSDVRVGTLNGTGSSPRVWGQDCEHIRTESGERIIPTRVGTR